MNVQTSLRLVEAGQIARAIGAFLLFHENLVAHHTHSAKKRPTRKANTWLVQGAQLLAKASE
jgi:hypothetical protein